MNPREVTESSRQMAEHSDRARQSIRLQALHAMTETNDESRSARIADHYLSMVNQARDIREIVQILRRPLPEKERAAARELLKVLTRDLAMRHENDLGITLQWGPHDPASR